MTSEKERLCIKQAYVAKLAIARAEFVDVVSFNNNPFEIVADVRWGETIMGKVLQVFVILVLIPPLLIWIVLAYIFNLLVISQNMMVFWVKTLTPSLFIRSTDASEERPLVVLWDEYGLDRYEASIDERLELLECWIRTLYGIGAEEFQLRNRMNAISHRHIESNRSYYNGTGGPHYHFLPPVDSLIWELSSELPQYKK